MTAILVLTLGGMGCSGDCAMTPTMDGVPPGDGVVCISEALTHASVMIQLCCEPGDGGSDDICQGTITSSNGAIGITPREVGEPSIPEGTCEWIQLDTVGTGIGSRANIVVQDNDCAIAQGCSTGFGAWNCPQCDFDNGVVEVCN